MSVIGNVIKNPKLAFNNALARANDASSGYAINNPKNVYRAAKNFFTPQSVYAAESTTPYVPENFTGYKKKPDGGYDYFVNSMPASIQDYQSAGGTLPTDEPSVTSGGQPVITDGASPAGSGGTASVDEAVGPMSGTVYNLKDPGQFQAYQEEKNNWVNDQYNTNVNTFNTSLTRSKQDLEKTKGALATSKKRFYGDTATGDIGDFQRGQQSIESGLRNRNANIYSTYSNLTPNGYQSAEGTNLDESKTLYNDAQTQATNEKADMETNFNTTDTSIARTAEDLVKSETEQPKYFDTWKATQLGTNKVNADQAKASLAAGAAKVSAAPTFTDKAYNWMSSAAKLYDENPNLPSSVYNNLVSSQAKQSGVTVGTGDYQTDFKKLAEATTSGDQTTIENIYRKYGLLK
jgi:hypothetical protein